MQPELEDDGPPRRLHHKGQVLIVNISNPEEEEDLGEEEVATDTPLGITKLQQSLMDPFMDFKVSLNSTLESNVAWLARIGLHAF
ncbi:hypothetical protein GOP47_0002067 [Adiantum capillus-veneris]|uniref:Uncharacterized protein n=1 Tax=Adiantum capillus-veneris TaxID=13818 RepID=A0A9D4VA62_ADICA|nr:hypothetical protein GOP47_0002067 [Adiantum capillus-veneris]